LLSPEYRAVAFDQRGHGNSERPECCYTVDDFAADVDAFMEAVGIEVPTLVGHSGGILIAARAVLSYPERVSRLALIGPAIIGANNEVMLELGEFMRTLEDPVAPEFAREFQESTIYHPLPEGCLETVVSESLKLPARVWRDYMEGVILTPDHTDRLGEINVPTLILWGEQDAMFPREDQERLARTIPDATLKVNPDTGHAVLWEHSEQVVRDLEEFMKDTRLVQ
jgi:non-heme chloroperoxidase